MPASVKLQELYGDDVQVIFIECQNTDKNTYEAFAWKMKWMGNNALWTNERVIPTVGDGLPEVAVIGVDGTVLLQGYPGDFGKKLEETVAAEVKKSKQPPAGTPKELEKAWKLFLAGDVTAALLECDKVGGDAGSEAKAEFLRRVGVRIARLKWLVDDGQLGKAEDLGAALAKSLKGHELATSVQEQLTRVASPEMANEREADKLYTSLAQRAAKEKPFDAGNVRKAESIVAKFSGTRSAARAERFVALSKVDVNK